MMNLAVKEAEAELEKLPADAKKVAEVGLAEMKKGFDEKRSECEKDVESMKKEDSAKFDKVADCVLKATDLKSALSCGPG